MRKLLLKILLFGANLFFVEDFYNSEISQSPFPPFPSSDGWEGGGEDSLQFELIKPFAWHIFTALYIEFQELTVFFFYPKATRPASFTHSAIVNIISNT